MVWNPLRNRTRRPGWAGWAGPLPVHAQSIGQHHAFFNCLLRARVNVRRIAQESRAGEGVEDGQHVVEVDHTVRNRGLEVGAEEATAVRKRAREGVQYA